MFFNLHAEKQNHQNVFIARKKAGKQNIYAENQGLIIHPWKKLEWKEKLRQMFT